MRQEVIYELIKTEQSYGRDLQVIVNEYLMPMQNRHIVSDSDIKMIFLNIEDILVCNASLLNRLENAQVNNYVDCVGFIFKEHSFECYTDYCKSLNVSLKYLQSLREEKKHLKNFLKDQMSNPECRQLDLSSFLLEPMQRITRYALLLKQILHYTSTSHRDHNDVLQALRAMEERVERINVTTTEFEYQEKVNSILRNVDFHKKKVDLTSPPRYVKSRKFVLEGPLSKAKSGRKLYGYLFNDIIIFTYPKSNSSIAMVKGAKYWLYRDPLYINEISLHTSPMGKAKMKETCFQIFHKNGVMTLKAPNASEKARWVDALKRVLNEYKEYDKERKNNAVNPKNFTKKFIGTLQISLEGSKIYVNENDINLFCTVNLGRQTSRTEYSHNVPNPIWNQPLIFEVVDMRDVLKITVINIDYNTNQEDSNDNFIKWYIYIYIFNYLFI
ncbi:Dbl homology domain-containing protein [Neocallimastix californiae]|uniref:Dbl homology domain-containing protein n=1 Tax=Neocallimastix californiae TaxID=1754190 RepID=A0A1Y1ZX75_9FUNG|nr:Dbl homology domain-containing protein [Neocallimastix californiae]|eukprot:ORY14856.1 Dbl homology domain-containing protein [Neocallimastix californiae]